MSARPKSREQQILDVAREMFSQRGYRDTSLQDIADQMGITRPAFYYYFRSKDEILWRLIENLGFQLLEQARPIAAGQGRPEARLREVAQRHVQLLLEHQDAFRVYFQARASVEGERDRHLRDGEHAYAGVIADLIREAQAEGDFRPGDADFDALLVTGLGNSVIRWFQPGGRLSAADVAARTADAAVAMLRATGQFMR